MYLKERSQVKYDEICTISSPFRSGSSSGVERKLPKLDVAGSTPVSRSNFFLALPMAFKNFCLICSLFILGSCGQRQLAPESPLDSPRNHYERGLVQLERGDLRSAQREFDRAGALDPKFAGAFVGRALVAMRKQDFWQARQDIGRAIHKDNDFIDAYIARGRIVTEEGLQRNYPTAEWRKEALSSFAKAIKKQPDYPASYYFRAQTYLQALQLEEARESLTKVLELNQGPLVAKAMREIETIQMVERAAPGSPMGLKIGLVKRISRAELAVLLLEEMKLGDIVRQRRIGKSITKFHSPQENLAGETPTKASDIAQSWAQPWIEEIIAIGIAGLEVFPDQTFQPDQFLTRSNYALVNQGVLLLLTGDRSLATKYVGEASRYPDVRADFYAYNAIALSIERGFMSTDKISGRFRPNDNVSGAEALLIIRELQNAFRLDF